MATIERLEDMLTKLGDKQEEFHGEMREHVGGAKQFQKTVMDRLERTCTSHDTLRANCEVTSKKVSWIIGVGTAVAFIVTTTVAIAALL